MQTPLDFVAREEAREHLDPISGEAFPQIDEKTQGEFLSPYPEIPRKALIGMRQVLAHDYFSIDEVAIFHICTTNIPPLIHAIRQATRLETSAGCVCACR